MSNKDIRTFGEELLLLLRTYSVGVIMTVFDITTDFTGGFRSYG